MDVQMNTLFDELVLIKQELQEIKKNMPDKELFLTHKEAELVEQSILLEKKNELISSKQLRNSLGL